MCPRAWSVVAALAMAAMEYGRRRLWVVRPQITAAVDVVGREAAARFWALLYAFARQESHFTPGAVSSQGAAGLMQLMPSTARAAAGFGDQNSGVHTASTKLADPSVNLDLAQRLIAYLLDQDQVKGNLLDLSIAYNGGMGLLAHYQGKRGHGDDPLLFLEALPSSDQRLYMERVLANFWIYQARLGQKPETLDSIVGGQWPIYTPPSRRIEVAQVNARN